MSLNLVSDTCLNVYPEVSAVEELSALEEKLMVSTNGI